MLLAFTYIHIHTYSTCAHFELETKMNFLNFCVAVFNISTMNQEKSFQDELNNRSECHLHLIASYKQMAQVSPVGMHGNKISGWTAVLTFICCSE